MTKMPAEFPTWYASLEAGEEGRAPARWQGVAKAIANPKVDEVEALIRMAIGGRQRPDSVVAARLLERISAGDPTFDPAGADREVQVLAASALVARLLPSDLAALALTTAHLDGARCPGLPMDLFGMAERAVRSKAQSSRERTRPQPVRAVPATWNPSEEELETLEPSAMVEGLQEAMNKAVAATVKAINEALEENGRALDRTDEELQMLWWLTGGHLSSGETIEGLKSLVRPFALGRDLAVRTRSRPGPMAIPALLTRGGLGRKGKIRIVEAVNAMADGWASSLVDGLVVSPVTHPIHEAFRRRNETGSGEDWIRNWSAVCEVPEDHALTPVRLAELFYRERLQLILKA
ncbi:GTPase-associated system all-helical protein GASH [uncultured Aureimonas sp.]|uniref:GTPase-associated system all-helical protein GASH n=1 Tax=uncultured Aureimonas sp. TaxID=1604662 RepID=UPI0025DED60D|nr:GTPase-associated system all-helical protein GASH [uncultured Aureimonas sp.]